VLAEKRYGVPIFGTMAHSFIQAHDDEMVAFERFARARPASVILLIDSYDTEAAARKVVALAPSLREAGITIRGVRIDSGDLIAMSRSVRRILDDGGLKDATIFVSGGVDEYVLARFVGERAPIDGFGIGTSLMASPDAPALDCAYKLQEYAGLPRRKRSAGKETWPGRKQVWRRFGSDGRMAGDRLSIEGDKQPGEALIEPVMQNGRRLMQPALADIRMRAAKNLEMLPEPLRRLAATPYAVEVAEPLKRLAAEFDRRMP
jgi:nicotinate phosphoribosyltransferase